MNNLTIAQLTQTFPKPGELVWIGVRPARGESMIAVDEVLADQRSGLIGDRYNGSSGKRQVTLIQWEHLAVLASMTGKTIAPEMLRRNLVIKGINLLALKDHTFQIGDAILQTTGLCHPCSKMEQILGTGGYNAMRGHGGLTARVVKSGVMRVGDSLIVNDS
ncbi:MAG: MOSC domain-containing protein [Methylococcaceae bacterium]|nr:MOSC domain-containing protein [Methylococcaceae bacterium]MDZ4156995.1 MOSC domain-containing protein [Methylococcales bacterium]MDP2392714.1 MOSC domain-containing protein [Methylococcaceae bacterium]MDP3018579.1 MOSC domain-containing protein [Methylococcaceae bacterium]MDP3391334.1 MOSC domain-containing protein [Methylococcaceae bacterium]